MSKPLGYSGTQIALHWGIAALIIYQFVYHEGIEEAYEQALETGVYAQSLGWASHAIPGIFGAAFGDLAACSAPAARRA